MISILKSRIFVLAVFAGVCFFVLSATTGNAQDKNDVAPKLVVATMDFPPFSMKTPVGEWEGLSIELLRLVARDLNVDIELRKFSRVDQIKNAIANSEVDLTPVASVTGDLESILDFSNPYYRSGSAIAVQVQGDGSKLFRLAEGLFSIEFLKVVVLLVLLWFIAGLLVWLFEKQQDIEMFSDKFFTGIGHGIWWAAVTMTTVGYGDKAPRTFAGRTVAIVWMFTSILLISSFTAAITTTLTVGELKGKVRGFYDLPSVRVGSLTHSQIVEQLAKNEIFAWPFKSIDEGLQALAEDEIDAFVYDEVILKHLVKTQYPGQLHVLADTFNHYYVSMALPPGSQLREPLNRALLRVMTQNEWQRIVALYLGVMHP
jgi:ABC-type amino acid transport substrate-binding protein